MTTSAAAFLTSPSLQAGMPHAGVRVKAENLSDAQKAAREFEVTFLNKMIDTMFETIEGGGTFGDSNASQTWRGMLSEQYANAVVDAGGIGISATVQRELIAMQEGNAL